MNTVAFIATDAQRRASRYYQMFPAEPVQPTGDLVVDSMVPFVSIDVVKLLKGIVHSSPKNVLTVSHGFSGGLSVDLSPRSHKPLGVDETLALNQCADGTLKVEEAAPRLELGVKDVVELKRAILQVRQLNLDKLVMRGCFIGQFPETLEALRHLFGAKMACAPDSFDVFGLIDPGDPADPNEFSEFIKSTSITVEGKPPNRFAWSASSGLKVALEVKAESRKAVTEWIALHFPKGKYAGKGPFAFHALLIGDRLVFPHDQQYRVHLKFVGAGQKP